MKRIIYILMLICCSAAVSAQDAELLKKAQAGDAEAQYEVASYYLRNGTTDSEEGMKWLIMAAENGNAHAQWELAYSYCYGWYGTKENDEQYVYWLTKAANNSDLENNKLWILNAQADLGDLYRYGKKGLEKNIAEFLRWEKKATFNGFDSAAFSLGLYYHYDGKDKQEAIYWYKKCMDLYWEEHQEEYDLAFKSLKELGVTYHPADHLGRNHPQSTASSTATTSSGSSDYSVQSNTSNNNKREPIAKGVYTVNSQGSSSYGYTGYGGDYTVNIEFYDDHITVNNLWCHYKDMINGKKRYEKFNETTFGGSIVRFTTYYIVDDNFNVEQQMHMPSPYGPNWFYYQMAKGEVVFPKQPITGYGNANQQNNYSSKSSNYSNSRTNNTNKVQETKHTCSLCHGNKRIAKDTYAPLYGAKDYKEKCNECGGVFMRSTGHIHITCPNCHGKGYF